MQQEGKHAGVEDAEFGAGEYLGTSRDAPEPPKGAASKLQTPENITVIRAVPANLSADVDKVFYDCDLLTSDPDRMAGVRKEVGENLNLRLGPADGESQGGRLLRRDGEDILEGADERDQEHHIIRVAQVG